MQRLLGSSLRLPQSIQVYLGLAKYCHAAAMYEQSLDIVVPFLLFRDS